VNLDKAVRTLEDCCKAAGLKEQPKEGQAEWYALRAYALGLSFLRSLKEKGVTTPVEFEAEYKAALRRLKGAVGGNEAGDSP
jgi:hypothetical protein